MIVDSPSAVRCLVSDDMGNRYSGMLVSYSEGIGKVLLPHGSVFTVDASCIFVCLMDLEALK